MTSRQDAKHERALKALLKLPDNRRCADCDTLVSFVCVARAASATDLPRVPAQSMDNDVQRPAEGSGCDAGPHFRCRRGQGLRCHAKCRRPLRVGTLC